MLNKVTFLHVEWENFLIDDITLEYLTKTGISSALLEAIWLVLVLPLLYHKN